MSDEREKLPRSRSQPRAKALLKLSLDNPYSKLKVSPLVPTSEIVDIIDRRRSEANKRLKAKASRTADDPDEAAILELDAIGELIGDDRRRAKYDERHPQNILLTVQQSASERAWRRHSRAGLISDWLYDIAGEEALLPTPRCLKLWAPSGIDPAVQKLLSEFDLLQPAADPPSGEPTTTLSIRDLDSLTKGD